MFRDLRPRILLAADDDAFCEAISFALTEEGYRPRTVGTEEAASEALRNASWALVVMDSLGTRSGPSLEAMIGRLSVAAEGTPFLLATGWSVDEQLAQRFASVIRKPFDLNHFLDVVARLLSVPAEANRRSLRATPRQ